MRARLGPLRSAVLLAVGFVVLRVVYRVVFGGADGAGALLLRLPAIPLGGPFDGTSLLGDITLGGVAAAAASALPFAALVLGFGVLATVVDIRSLLARGAVRGPVRTVARSLVIAWATFPALADSVRAVRQARELRGERSAASLVVPVLERTVERAIALGASMELRGFAARGSAPSATATPAVLDDVSLGFDGRRVLSAVDLTIPPGTLTVVTGATGSGKSTLLSAMSGLFQHAFGGEQRGRIEVAGIDRLGVPPRETARVVGAVPQSVRLSFVASTVAEEIGFALAVRSLPREETRERVHRVAERVGVAPLLDRSVDTLSAGEATLVALAAAIVGGPRLLLVDEPLAELDDQARERIVAVLDRLAHEDGVGVVVAEHAVAEWGAACDRWIELRGGGALPTDGAPTPGESESVQAVRPGRGAPIAQVRHLTVRHGEVVAVDDVSFTLDEGDVVALTGPNGAGKSSLVLALALPADRGVVEVRGTDVAALRRRERRRAVALVPERIDDLLFATTVRAECRRADRVSGDGSSDTAGLFLRLLGADHAGPHGLLDRHPRDLSAGERLCLVLAIQLASAPSVLLVDEPARGLDASARRLVGRALVTAAAGGTAVVMATHDARFAARYATRTVRMARGAIEAPLGVSP